MNNKDNQNKALELNNVSLKIRTNSRRERSIKNIIIRSVTGGMITSSHQGSVVEALRNINITINKGERVALIGHNGAGKSSFLRLVAGIYKPTSGLFKAYVSVFPMIQKTFITGAELTGFHAIKAQYLMTHGQLHGFNSFLDDVVEFSELSDYIYMPIRTYSEGMTARLLFALLTAECHECLALDEGFGTGDARFVGRAEVRLKRFIEDSGTLILASHSDDLLEKFCRRGIVFEHGEIIYDAELKNALKFYHERNG